MVAARCRHAGDGNEAEPMKAILRSGYLALGITVLAGSANAGPLEDGLVAYSRKDYATAVKLIRPLAEQGDADAQTNLGIMYNNGQGVLHDYVEAVEWFRKAAEQGHVGAQVNLSFMYEKGQGVLQDDAEAAKWYDLANAQLSDDGNNLDWFSEDSITAAEDYSSLVWGEAGAGHGQVVAFYSSYFESSCVCDYASFGCSEPGKFSLKVTTFDNEGLARWLAAGKAEADLSTNGRQFSLAGYTIQHDELCGAWDIDFVRMRHTDEIWSALLETSAIEITVGSRKIHIALNAADKAKLATVAETCLGGLLP